MNKYPHPFVSLLVVSPKGEWGLVKKEQGWTLPEKSLGGGETWKAAVEDLCVSLGVRASPSLLRLYVGKNQMPFVGFLAKAERADTSLTYFRPENLPEIFDKAGWMKSLQ